MRLSLFRDSTFRVQIGLVFAVFVVILVTIVSLVLGRMMANSIRTDAGNALHVVASNTSRILADGMHARLMIATSLAASPSLWERGLDAKEVTDALTQEQMTWRKLAWLGVTDANGVVKAATRDLLVGVDVHHRPWFAAGLRGPQMGDVHDDALLAGLLPTSRNGEPQRFIDFAAPIKASDRTIGVVAIHGSWDWPQSLIEELQPKNAGEIGLQVFIFDRVGKMIYAPDHRLDPDPDFGKKLVAANNRSGKTASVLTWTDGKPYLTSVAPLMAHEVATNLGWVVVAREPADIAFAPAHEATQRILLIALLAALSASLVAFAVAGSLSKPLAKIAEAAHAVQAGDTTARIPVFRNNAELAKLSTALGSMTDQLQAAMHTLEDTVRERTTELTAANADLGALSATDKARNAELLTAYAHLEQAAQVDRGRTLQLEEANRHLEELARIDPLTGLLNRRAFAEQSQYVITAARRRKSATSILMIDIDHFKSINDTYGHPAGDEVLVKLAAVLKNTVRETDLVARVGGEEFIVLLPETDLAGAKRVADNLVKIVEATDLLESARDPVTISVGVALHDDQDEGFAAVKRADTALYEAKKRGRNQSWAEDSIVGASDEMPAEIFG